MATTVAPDSAMARTMGAASWQTGQVTLKKASTVGPGAACQGSDTGSPVSMSGSVNDGARAPWASMAAL